MSFICRGMREISCKKYKKVCEVYISPYCRLALVQPNFMTFGIRGQRTDVIMCVKFLVDQFRIYGVLTPQNCHFPLTCCVALITVYALPCNTVIWNGTVFVDLDWPLNASRRLSASAELLVLMRYSLITRTRRHIQLAALQTVLRNITVDWDLSDLYRIICCLT